MSLLNDDLTVWEIGFRWAGHDSEQLRLRLPMPVRDNFRVLMDAILCGHLACITLGGGKYQGDDPEEARLYIRYWLDDVNSCIEGQAFSKKMLKWGRIERWDFQCWCERRSIPLPEFWFHPGWELEYQWKEETLIIPDSGCELDPTQSTADSQRGQASADIGQDSVEDTDPTMDKASPSESPKKLRENQRRSIAVQVVGASLWRRHPEMTIAAMVKHEVIQSLCGAEFQVPEVVRKWLRAVAPAEVKQRRGRPRSENGTADD